ncbi:hypothetical protein BCR39DRAFT_561240 [Naematelia encephala]|uniref:Homeobox domain-containing protein n=1 Tax=Naematelia encephala TaxID=71784 RepID=A0A1Y2AR57_9TREE|nr:hypothetical protein BCR39DRAFT_561240 [Naematelia encephala]
MSFSPDLFGHPADEEAQMIFDPSQLALPLSTSVSPNDSSYGYMSSSSTPLFPSPTSGHAIDSASTGNWSNPLPVSGGWAFDYLQNPPMTAPVVDQGFMMPPPMSQNVFADLHHSWTNLPSASPISPSAFSGLTPLDTRSTSLTPLFSAFNTDPPTTQTPQMQLRPSPVRHYSASTLPLRRRSSTLMTLGSATSQSPATPQWSDSQQQFPSPHIDTGSGLNRHTSMPIFHHLARRYHPTPRNMGMPSPFIESPHSPLDPQTSPKQAYGLGAEAKPPRFKPTKEQLEILIASYKENKNPDGPAREALSKRLGPDIKPKTLQIWFQNRRSKSRAKERDAALPRPTRVQNRTDSPRLGLGGRPVDIEALRLLTHEPGVGVTILPITVLSISTWTRFLTPGSALPDLACALSTTALMLYVMHQGETFRISIPLSPTSIFDLTAASNPSANTEAVAVRFNLVGGAAQFGCWNEGKEWQDAGDFTSGSAGRGGKVEITGDRSVLLPAFGKVQQDLLSATMTIVGSAAATVEPSPSNSQSDQGLLLSKWRFPTTSPADGFCVEPLSSEHQVDLPSRVRSYSAPIHTGLTMSTLKDASMPWADLGSGVVSSTDWSFDDTAVPTPVSSSQASQALTSTDGTAYGIGSLDSGTAKDTTSSGILGIKEVWNCRS